MVTNKKLLAILERVEYDRPILIRDKLEIIWEQKEKKKEPNPLEISSIQKGVDIDDDYDYDFLEDLDVQNPIGTTKQVTKKKQHKIVNEQGLKRELERRKLER